ncbi:copper resistance protein B [Kiloniella laminariae]|uniref:Copper resistance protein B n=1 Tax=Kiloniella laminariae TaxID=454162 RepID=A0ABT4LF02_9PROT|nr:copper resistance protein B [Kiloniella laminariae]MCZ4279681.1 copper resistance protein B [Kiloniella laminariae]
MKTNIFCKKRSNVPITALLTGVAVSFAPINLAWAVEPVPYVYYGTNIEQFEYRFSDDNEVAAWDGYAFVGTDELKFRLESSGEYALDESAFETLEHQGLLQIPVSGFWDAKAGLRYDAPVGEDRGYAVLGLTGLAPQWFEVDADLFLSEKGDFSTRLEADYELLLTNRLILRPVAEVNIAFSEDEEVGIGRGLSSLETGVRLSYDLVDRTIAPYVGVHYERNFGDTRDLVKEDGGKTDEVFFVTGLRVMF